MNRLFALKHERRLPIAAHQGHEQRSHQAAKHGNTINKSKPGFGNRKRNLFLKGACDITFTSIRNLPLPAKNSERSEGVKPETPGRALGIGSCPGISRVWAAIELC